jgi:hypothetical protein
MAEQQGVYKTEVSCSIGFSIQSPDGSWEKSNVSIKSDVGPGYPEPELMSYVAKMQMDDAVKICEEQIGSIASKIVEQVALKERS